MVGRTDRTDEGCPDPEERVSDDEQRVARARVRGRSHAQPAAEGPDHTSEPAAVLDADELDDPGDKEAWDGKAEEEHATGSELTVRAEEAG